MSVKLLAAAAIASWAIVALVAACQGGTTTREPPRIGGKTFAPITLEDAAPYVLVPDGARLLQPATKPGDMERVIAAYCMEDATVDAVATTIRAQLTRQGWVGIDVKQHDDDTEGLWYLVAARYGILSTSVEIMRTEQRDCDAPGEVAIGVTVYRVRDKRSATRVGMR